MCWRRWASRRDRAVGHPRQPDRRRRARRTSRLSPSPGAPFMHACARAGRPEMRFEESLMPAVQETIAQVRALDVDKYKYGFTTDIESDLAPKGLNEDIVRFISAKKNEPAMDDRLAAAGLPPLGRHEGADLGARPLSEDRLPGSPLLRRAEAQRAREPRRGRSGNPGDLRAPRHPAEGAGDSRRRPQGRRR